MTSGDATWGRGLLRTPRQYRSGCDPGGRPWKRAALSETKTRTALQPGFPRLWIRSGADGIAEATFGKGSQSVRAHLAARAQSASPQIGRADWDFSAVCYRARCYWTDYPVCISAITYIRQQNRRAVLRIFAVGVRKGQNDNVSNHGQSICSSNVGQRGQPCLVLRIIIRFVVVGVKGFKGHGLPFVSCRGRRRLSGGRLPSRPCRPPRPSS